MLKKLFVHEWKDCWRLVGLMNLIVIGLTLIGTVVCRVIHGVLHLKMQ